MKNGQENYSQKPERKILDKKISSKEINCKDCYGSGKIMRMTKCCTNGCSTCKGDKYIINPIWKSYRKQPIKNDSIFQCSICLADVGLSTNKYVLSCKHEFHPDCIFRWMKQSKKCPVCRQSDVYLQGQVFPVSEEQSIVIEGIDEDQLLPENLMIERGPSAAIQYRMDSSAYMDDSWIE